ncbi:MAG: plasmid mobilization relaxosome protein MobC [Ruminococcus sp.]|nr:plasmid mobilization relaxosome protein MobC [Ruminococcus sp.]MCM1381779.1 plasmid mobilization relaxosome protein MobC [Muribaculaceae bacterium]MCM1480182.1 plasmid mobilization relaxosome protein MobC [Muribaculaceae bacterium]MCM1525455.1 plasmid mobilization relaxosome protein MobC [Ruminococcus sp.]
MDGNAKKAPNRKRSIVMNFRVTEDEKALILAKKQKCGFRSLEAYLRQAAVYEKINLYDFSEINRELSIIGKNINQIAARVNSTNRIYDEDIAFLKKKVEEIWRLQKFTLSKIH